MLSLILALMLPISSQNDNPDKDSDEYYHCIENKPCQHDREDLTKLTKKEYIETMQCRIDRHMKCIKTDIEKKNEKSNRYFKY